MAHMQRLQDTKQAHLHPSAGQLEAVPSVIQADTGWVQRPTGPGRPSRQVANGTAVSGWPSMHCLNQHALPQPACTASTQTWPSMHCLNPNLTQHALPQPACTASTQTWPSMHCLNPNFWVTCLCPATPRAWQPADRRKVGHSMACPATLAHWQPTVTVPVVGSTGWAAAGQASWKPSLLSQCCPTVW